MIKPKRYKMNMQKPIVTVCIPAYNHEKYIRSAINSVIEQTYNAIELIIINDGSTDTTHDVIKALEQQCIERFVKFTYLSQTNHGISDTLNKMLHMAIGEYFIITSSDDGQTKERVEVFVDFMTKHPNYDFCYSGYTTMDESGISLKSILPLSHELTFEQVLFRQQNISYISYMARINALKNIGGYIKGIKIEDWELALRITAKGYKVFLIDKPLYSHRLHKNNTQKKWSFMEEGRFEILQQYKEHPSYETAVLFWKNRYDKRRYSVFFSETYQVLSRFNSPRHTIVIYGNGSFGKIISLLISQSNFCFVDKTSTILSKTILPHHVYSVDNLHSMVFDYVIVSVLWQEIDIINDLRYIYKIPQDKIVQL